MSVAPISADTYAVLLSISEAYENSTDATVSEVARRLRTRGHTPSNKKLSKRLNGLVGMGYLNSERTDYHFGLFAPLSYTLTAVGDLAMKQYLSTDTNPAEIGRAHV